MGYKQRQRLEDLVWLEWIKAMLTFMRLGRKKKEKKTKGEKKSFSPDMTVSQKPCGAVNKLNTGWIWPEVGLAAHFFGS